MKLLIIILVGILSLTRINAQSRMDSLFPVRGFCIAAPNSNNLDSFINFISVELASRKVNTLVLRVDHNYQYSSHPELVGSEALSEPEVKKIVLACKQSGIRIIPQINLLGHQSWASTTGKLLSVYPQFDETPHVKMPDKYVWPNADSLYCKSYCPLHPEVHKVVFDLVDEICAVFESDAFHAGLDEVFYLGESKCPRCAGKNKAELFANEVKKIQEHLAIRKRELWIWGDRLLDGYSTGLGMWEASHNNTSPAIDLIPKSVVICDWHYERPDKTAVYFAMKGFRVITCPWRNPFVAKIQVNDMASFRSHSISPTKERFYGMMQTVWTSAGRFMATYYKNKTKPDSDPLTAENCFIVLYSEMERISGTR